MTTLVTVLKGGGRYDATWVERLARGVRRHAPAFDRILCLTDLPLEVPGVVGPDQLAWLGKTLDAHPGKPALVMVHHNPQESPDRKLGGLTDTAALFDVLSPRRQAKALFFGHTHRWEHAKRDDGLYLVNLPAVAYVFKPDQPSGWVDCRLGTKGATLELRTLDANHPWAGQRIPMRWRK